MSTHYFPQRYSPEISFEMPMGACPSDRFLPVLINSKSLQTLGVYPGDVLAANTSQRAENGRFSAICILDKVYLGYIFRRKRLIKLEMCCTCPKCPPLYFSPNIIMSIGPIVWQCSQRHGVTFDFIFSKRRDELWET